jgi:hypothetical protein
VFKKLAIGALGCVVSLSALAFKLSPEGSFIERRLTNQTQSWLERVLTTSALSGVHIFGASVHEEITNRILGCDGDEVMCGSPEYDPDFAYVLAGVRWNDDPPFRFEKGQGNFSGCEADTTIRFVTFPRCWGAVFKDGEKRAKAGTRLNGSNAPMLVRSHFGDLQFLHAMASSDKESPTEVQARILMWSELTWRIALGEFPLSQRVKDIPVVGIKDYFGDKGWSIQDLFALGNPLIRKPDQMSKVAFGSLLHVVEDSFANGHVERRATNDGERCHGTTESLPAPGKIVEFHSYTNQDSKIHGQDDSRTAFSVHWTSASPDVIDVGRTLNAFYQKQASWTEVKPYIECIFALDSEARVSSAGDKYSH